MNQVASLGCMPPFSNQTGLLLPLTTSSFIHQHWTESLLCTSLCTTGAGYKKRNDIGFSFKELTVDWESQTNTFHIMYAQSVTEA